MGDKKSGIIEKMPIKSGPRELKHGISVCVGPKVFKGSSLISVGPDKTEIVESKTRIVPATIIETFNLPEKLFL